MASSSTCSGTQKYPYPCHVNPSGFVSIKLSGNTNYHLWFEQISCLIVSHGMQGFFDGNFTDPGEPNREEWKRSDSLVKGWIFGSLSEDVMSTVVGLDTAMGVWQRLNAICSTPPPPATTSTPPPPATTSTPPPPATTSIITTSSATTSSATTNVTNVNEYFRLYKSITRGELKTTKEHFDKDYSAISAMMNTSDDSVLHIAMRENENTELIENLLKVIHPNSLSSMVDLFGRNPLHYAAELGYEATSKMLVEQNPHLLFILDNQDTLPIHISALSVHNQAFPYLLEVCKQYNHISDQPGYLSPFKGRHGALLLIWVIIQGFLNIAYELIKEYPEMARTKYKDAHPLLRIAGNSDVYYSGACYNFYQRFVYSCVPIDNITGKEQDIENQKTYKDKVVSGCRRSCFHTVRHIKNLKEDKVKHNMALTLLESICDEVSKLNENNDIKEQNTQATLEAAQNDTPEAFEALIKYFPQAIESNSDGYYIMQIVIMNRNEKVYNLFLHKMNVNMYQHKVLKDKDGNNLLHLAAHLAPIHKLNLVSGAALQMQRELQWFHEVEKFVERDYRELENNRQQTPIMVFRQEHKELRKEGEEWMKKTADSYTITAALIITIVFAAAITVPGGNNGDTGKAVYQTKHSFIVFAVSDAISLFTSTTSLLLFLSILTARYRDEDFLHSLPKRLIFGLVMLFLSVTSLMIAFSATLYIVFGQENNWILIPIAALTCLPITSFVTLQFPLLVELISSTYGQGIFGKQK